MMRSANKPKANVATAVVKQLSNLRLEVLLENRDALSRKVREEVSPTSSQWGFNLGSTYIRKVAFRDKGMIAEMVTAVDWTDFGWGLIKTVVFGWAVVVGAGFKVCSRLIHFSKLAGTAIRAVAERKCRWMC